MVSVIIPTYNSEKYITTTLESVIAQTYRDLEVLIMNDCSWDKTAEIVERYAFRDPRIKLVNLVENKGVSAARNKGVEMASGEWIAYLDSDDLWKPDKIEKQLRFAEKLQEKLSTRPDLIFTGSAFMDEGGNTLTSILHVPEKVNFKELLKQNLISCSSVLIRRSLMLKYPMPCIDDAHEDFVTWLCILKSENIFAYGLDEPLLIYRVMKSSRSGNKLKAAIMTFKAYRYIGLNFAQSLWNWKSYAIRSLRKYRKIKR